MAGSFSNLTAGVLGNSKKALLIVQSGDTELPATTADILKQTSSILTKATGLDLSKDIGTGERALVVQYNPATLSIQSSSQPTAYKKLLSENDPNVIAQDTRSPATTLTVVLMFDDMNVKDAFMAEKFQPPTNVGAALTTIAAIANAKKGYSVQQQTNALVALPLWESTRKVVFKWATMSFSGIVTQAQARYTMFSVSGRPIRSEVTLTITHETLEKGDVKYWKEAFDKGFKSELSGSGGAKSVSESIGSLINISGF